MVNEQLEGTLDLIAKIEQAIADDVQSVALVSRDEQGNMQNNSRALKARRRSTGNFSFGHIARLLKGNEAGGVGNLNVSVGDSTGEFTGEKKEPLTRWE